MKILFERNLNLISIEQIIIEKENLFLKNEIYFNYLLKREYSILNQLDKTIDLKRFEQDKNYRQEKILNLFSCDSPSFDYVEQLAIRNQISIDQCHLIYFDYLLTKSKLSFYEIHLKFKPFLQSEKMKTNREMKLNFLKLLSNSFWPIIHGKDHQRLKFYFQIKKSLGDTIHSQKHLETIQKLILLLSKGFFYFLFFLFFYLKK